MTNTIIAMQSQTSAMNACKRFQREGFRCEVIRNPKSLNTGCGFSIKVNTDSRTAIFLLDEYRIPYKTWSESQVGGYD